MKAFKIIGVLAVSSTLLFADTLLDLGKGELSVVEISPKKATSADLATKLSTNAVIQTLSGDETDKVPTVAAVRDVINPYGVNGGTNYLAQIAWDATNKVFTVTETAQ